MSAAERLPYGFARRHGVLSLSRDDEQPGALEVVYRPDADYLSLVEVGRFFGQPILPRMVEPGEFERLLEQVYRDDNTSAAQMMDDIGDLDLAEIARRLPEPQDLLESDDDAPIIRLINALLTEAVKEQASDIHIESFENALRVRFRIDGVLREALSPPREIGPLLISRVKVMAHLDIAEKRLPQDGRISLRIGARAVDVRVSTIPTGHGERIVMRLLDKRSGRLELSQLGLARENRERLVSLVERPHGILLVTGPTGSGKTTTLYGMLNHLNDRRRNILTVEDPIEYDLDGISQTQVNRKVELSFARSLRAILRQDPDVVMVGEIRDLETAQIAVQASLTGHLVLSTLHTNSAVGAITRLRDMGVEPFLLASSLVGVVAQRLVRVLCPHCKTAEVVDDTLRQRLQIDASVAVTEVFRSGGCEHCQSHGYRGRTGVFEIVPISNELQALIHDQAGEHQLEQAARALAPSLLADTRERVLAGMTSLAEFVRVTDESDHAGL